jgi:ADP-ribosyl-[dinitrogen reductase] hydrolase
MAGKRAEDFAHLRKFSTREYRTQGTIMHAYNMAWQGVLQTNSFEDALVYVVNKGNDADTNGAVAGMLAGRLYGYSNIPKRWLDKLVKHDELLAMAEALYKLGGTE